MTAYLDHNATTPLRPDALDAMTEAARLGGNPSSVHSAGRAARGRVEAARADLAQALGAPQSGIVFTSGATEALDLALTSAVAAGARRVLVSAIEHDAVIEPSRTVMDHGAERAEIPVTADGVVDLAALDAMLSDDASDAAVCVMAANNETGVIQPAAEACALARSRGARTLVDAVQVFGKSAVQASDFGADYVAVSAHKLGGPAGVGAMLAFGDAPVAARLRGGGQELGRRAGTENVVGIAGFAAAATTAVAQLEQFGALADIRDGLEAAVRDHQPDVVIFGASAERLANTSCLALPGVSAETLVMALDLDGVAVSAGAACSSGRVRPSRVVMAMGADSVTAGSAIRVSLGWTSSQVDADHFITAWSKATARVAQRQPAA